MRRFLATGVVVGCACLVSGAMYISETQAIVQGGLTDLKFQVVKQEGGLIGAPSRLKITPKTIKHLRSLMKQGKELSIAADGKIEVVDSADAGSATEKTPE